MFADQFDDPQVFDDPNRISIGSMDFDNPKVYGDTSITDGLVYRVLELTVQLIVNSSTYEFSYRALGVYQTAV